MGKKHNNKGKYDLPPVYFYFQKKKKKKIEEALYFNEYTIPTPMISLNWTLRMRVLG